MTYEKMTLFDRQQREMYVVAIMASTKPEILVVKDEMLVEQLQNTNLHWLPYRSQFRALEWLLKYCACVMPAALWKERTKLALFSFFWGPSLIFAGFQNGEVWRKHYKVCVFPRSFHCRSLSDFIHKFSDTKQKRNKRMRPTFASEWELALLLFLVINIAGGPGVWWTKCFEVGKTRWRTWVPAQKWATLGGGLGEDLGAMGALAKQF